MAVGTSLYLIKQALVTQIGLTTLDVFYQSPMKPDELIGSDGLASVCWIGDDANAEIDTNLMMGTPLWVDETVTLELIIQVLGKDTSYDQPTVDGIAGEMLGDAIAVMLSNPSLNITDTDDIQVFQVLPVGYEQHTGFLPTGARAAGFKLNIEGKARLKLATVNGNP